MPYIEFADVVRAYGAGSTLVHALDGASFAVEKGELAVILGQSGAGKTTALNILGGMDRATSGRVVVGERDVSHATEDELVMYRREDVGFVFQFYNLVPNLTALENVELAAQYLPGLAGRRGDTFQGGPGRPPGKLPGPALWRRAAARLHCAGPGKEPKDRCSATSPRVRLTTRRASRILQLLQDACRRDGITVIIVTHNAALADMADRLIRFKSGRVTQMSVNPSPVPIAQIEW